MAKPIALLILFCMVLPGPLAAQSRYFLGTRTGLCRTQEAFLEGRYKNFNMFLVIGARPTNDALREIRTWRSKTTYAEDIRKGAEIFSDQAGASLASVPVNGKAIAHDVVHLGLDPVNEIRDINLITPAALVYKTVVNVVKLGWHGIKIVGEPVVRVGAGSLALVGSPFIKPATYTGVYLIYTGTALYGYGSSAVGGAVMLGATGAVLTLDIATAPLVAAFAVSQPEKDDNKDEKENAPVGEAVALP